MKKNRENYNHRISQENWQNKWQESNVFAFDESSDKEKYYVLEMFPYPSGKIHMGHLRNYAIGDVIARFKMMKGYNVLHPMGFDSFGLPAENAALEHQVHPEEWTLKNIETMKAELKSIGLSIDWSKELATCLPDYYKHEQKIFIDFVKNGLAYQKESFVNWDPVDQTVLANEQVIDGRGWRSGALVEKKKLKQWFLKVSDFSEELLQELKNLKGWDERVLSMQEKWIGKSEGLTMRFELKFDEASPLNYNTKNEACQAKLDENDEKDEKTVAKCDNLTKIEVYTTRPDTLFGAAFIGISANHALATKLAQNNEEIQAFIDDCNKNSADEATLEKQEKRGIRTGIKAINPINGEEIEVFIANFVLMDYGSGAVFGCPAHDERDYEFAKKYDLKIKQVVAKKDGGETELPFTESGIMVNSEFLDGLNNKEAKKKVIDLAEEKGFGEKKVNYRLRDWGVSRQRYWGCPIPMLYLENGEVVAVPEDQLPVELPKDVVFDGQGNPLAKNENWKNTTYVDENGKEHKAVRETDTFDTFFESSWYFLRYISQPKNKAFEKDLVNKFMPVDQYVGGVEHAVLHLLYARFFVKALKKCGYLDFNEPFKNLLTQGMVCHQTFKDEDGKWVFPSEVIEKEKGEFVHQKTGKKVVAGRSEKMSKSKKNVVEPAQIISDYGADTARLFMLSDSPVNRDLEWSDGGIDGAWKYVNRLWKLVDGFVDEFGTDEKNAIFNAENSKNLSEKQLEIVKNVHKTILDVENELEKIGFNRAIAKIRELSNLLEKFEIKDELDKKIMSFALRNLVLLFSAIMPHLAEECYARLGFEDLVVKQDFPEFDKNLTEENSVKIAVQVLGKLRAVIEMEKDLENEKVEEIAKANENVAKFLKDKIIRKVIVVKNKLVNFVIT